MARRHIYLTAVLTLGYPIPTFGQSAVSPDNSIISPVAPGQNVVPPDYSTTYPVPSGQNAVSPHHSTDYSASPGRHKSPGQKDPAATAAQQQSGLSQTQAQALLQERGYNRVSGMRPQPNALWVWQADAMQNGRPVRLGIDYRGNVLEIPGGAAQPCAVPGVRLGNGSFGPGAALSGVTACSGR